MTINSSVDDGQRTQLHPVSPIAELTRFGTTTAHAAAGVGRFVLHTAGDALRGRPPGAARVAHEIRTTFEHLGPTYVKLGQLIASSPGVFSESMSTEFESLLDRVKPADPALMRAQFIAELGRAPEEVFATFDPVPIFVQDGDTYTSAGVTSALDLTLSFIEADAGAALARDVARDNLALLVVHRSDGQVQRFYDYRAS